MKGNTMDHGQCLTEETIAEYLEGGLDPALKAASEVHMVACDECRHNLGFFMHLLDEDVTSNEARELELIAAEWDRKRPGKKHSRGLSLYRKWLLALTGVAAALVFGVLSVEFILDRATEPNSANEVVQLLLSQKRPFEPRMSGQPHLPIVRTRGADDQGVAYGLLAGEMTRLSANTHEMGRFYLLQKDFGRALEYLRMAEREPGASAQVHNDLGVAYLESGDESNLQNAANEFRDALALDPSFAPAAFNLAVLHERTGRSAEAEEQWLKYLQIDSESPWAVEARSRLEGRTR